MHAILSLGKSLGMRVIAEGVETVEQVRLLHEMGRDSLQGYYFSRPVRAGDIPALIARITMRG